MFEQCLLGSHNIGVTLAQRSRHLPNSGVVVVAVGVTIPSHKIPVFFLIRQTRKQPFRAAIWVGTL